MFSSVQKEKLKILFDKVEKDLTFHIAFGIMYAFLTNRGVAQLVARSVRDTATGLEAVIFENH